MIQIIMHLASLLVIFNDHSTIIGKTKFSFFFPRNIFLQCSNPDEVIGILNLPNPSSCTMALGSTQPLTEMSTRNLPWGKVRPAREADKLTAIFEPIV
jgi:hypothetical protein